MKEIIIIVSFMFIFNYSNSQEMNNQDLAKIVNSFLCSDDIKKMSGMVEYPVFFIKETNLFDKHEFVKGVKQTQIEDGIYKLGKKCNNFQWDIAIRTIDDKGRYIVFVVSSINKNEAVKLFINKDRKIIGFIGN